MSFQMIDSPSEEASTGPVVDAADVSPDVLIQEREVAIQQARGSVLIQAAFLAAVILILVVFRPSRETDWLWVVVITGAVALVYHARWWLRLRESNPFEAYGSLQQREEFERFARRTRLTLFIMPVAFALWWWFGR
jgi:hypothetical protein